MPGVFPPVMINVSVDGRPYQEMHVDGGAIAQAFLYPASFSLKAKLKELGAKDFKPVAYIIRNGRLYRPEESVERQTLKIAQQAISTMTASSAVNDLYRMYLTTKRDGVQFNLAYIEDDFHLAYKGPFDKAYMNSLFEHGYQAGINGYNGTRRRPVIRTIEPPLRAAICKFVRCRVPRAELRGRPRVRPADALVTKQAIKPCMKSSISSASSSS